MIALCVMCVHGVSLSAGESGEPRPGLVARLYERYGCLRPDVAGTRSLRGPV